MDPRPSRVLKLFLSHIPKRDSETKKTPLNIKVCPESLILIHVRIKIYPTWPIIAVREFLFGNIAQLLLIKTRIVRPEMYVSCKAKTLMYC